MKRELSLLFVCVGNTCRSPMAEVLAKQRWPERTVRSAGVCVHPKGQAAAWEAASAMTVFGLSLNGHEATPIDEVDPSDFDYIIAMDPEVKRVLLEEKGISKLKLRELYVDDPFQRDTRHYEDCGDAIANKLAMLES